MEKHKIIIIDDHPIIHDGLRILLSNEPDMEVVDIAESATQAMEKLKDVSPDLAIVDLSMGDSDGTYLIQRIHTTYPNLKMLVYTMSEERLFAERTHTAGASGYVMKTTPPKELKEAIRTVLAGRPCFHPDIQKRIDKKSETGKDKGHTLLDVLSNREIDIFKLLGEGMDSVLIGKKLKISRNTVDTHRINIKNKLDLPNGKALERLAFEILQHKKNLPD
ncbi:MAG: response regulator transcription factor [Pontiellaceae bacterium]|nr:response regulator transcription factor [Pontiellaceae bacterium]MBN2783535.1 response regulator transcription factor [Pontiellaceae bacterium]